VDKYQTSFGWFFFQDAFAMTVAKKQSGRKRWGGGGGGGHGLSETWDDWGDFDLGSPSKTTKKVPPVGAGHNKENDDDDDFLA
jgi:hypothetical protein